MTSEVTPPLLVYDILGNPDNIKTQEEAHKFCISCLEIGNDVLRRVMMSYFVESIQKDSVTVEELLQKLNLFGQVLSNDILTEEQKKSIVAMIYKSLCILADPSEAHPTSLDKVLDGLEQSGYRLLNICSLYIQPSEVLAKFRNVAESLPFSSSNEKNKRIMRVAEVSISVWRMDGREITNTLDFIPDENDHQLRPEVKEIKDKDITAGTFGRLCTNKITNSEARLLFEWVDKMVEAIYKVDAIGAMDDKLDEIQTDKIISLSEVSVQSFLDSVFYTALLTQIEIMLKRLNSITNINRLGRTKGYNPLSTKCYPYLVSIHEWISCTPEVIFDSAFTSSFLEQLSVFSYCAYEKLKKSLEMISSATTNQLTPQQQKNIRVVFSRAAQIFEKAVYCCKSYGYSQEDAIKGTRDWTAWKADDAKRREMQKKEEEENEAERKTSCEKSTETLKTLEQLVDTRFYESSFEHTPGFEPTDLGKYISPKNVANQITDIRAELISDPNNITYFLMEKEEKARKVLK